MNEYLQLRLRPVLVLICLSFCILSGSAQESRKYDGTGNNIQNPTWGSAGEALARKTAIDYADGISLPGGVNRPNARAISNTLFAQDSLITDALNLSDFVWVFGQFIDHDITIVPDGNELANISVPLGDPWFDPFGTGIAFIGMYRSDFVAGTGTSFANPREHFNAITAWIDASAVYGSDNNRANWLRSFSGGKLKTSAGNLLPFNTIDGELDSEIDTNAPEMANPVGLSDKFFVAGDIRANENLLLTSIHTLFMREHNRICEELILANPSWTDEMLYQHARKMLGGMFQAVVYEEWLPAMGVHLSNYSGYNNATSPNIFNVFSASAYRLGHTLLNSNIRRMDNSGNTIPQGDVTLQNAFFNPMEFVNGGGVDPLLKGMGVQIEQELDAKLVDDVRNFLFGPPGSGGLDLAAININRGRERGIADFNQVRQDFNLTPYNSINEMSSSTEVANALTQLYGDVNDIDSWVGMLAEDHMPDALFGPTIMKIMEEQFTAIRDGDRFYYEIDPDLSAEEKTQIKNTTLHDIIMRNTGITLMQDNVFEAMPHDSIPSNIFVSVETESFVAVPSVVLDIQNNTGGTPAGLTNQNGTYDFSNLIRTEEYTITPTKNSTVTNGLGLSDMLMLRKHLLSIEKLNSPYQLIAADVNMQDGFTILDMIEMQKVILNINQAFPSNTAWRFVDANYAFIHPTDPFGEDFPESIAVFPGEEVNIDFVGIKLGDIDNSADPNNLIESEVRGFAGTMMFELEDQELRIGERYELAFKSTDISEMEGYQFTLEYDTDVLRFATIQTAGLENLTTDNFGVFEEEGAITTIWYGDTNNKKEEVLFTISFIAQKTGKLSDLVKLSSRLTQTEAYNKDLELMDVALNFNQHNITDNSNSSFELYQNKPNPFQAITTIGFDLPKAGVAALKIYDISGRELMKISQQFTKGYNKIEINQDDLASSGVLYYQLQTDFGTKTKKMILLGSIRP